MSQILFAVGLVVILPTVQGVLFAMVLPRRASRLERISMLVDRSVRLGFVVLARPADVPIDVAAGSTWVVVVALQIAYLPALDFALLRAQGFRHAREQVRSARVGAGTARSPPACRHYRHPARVVRGLGGMGAPDRQEPHVLSRAAVVPFFGAVVLVALGATCMLDGAALHLAVAPSTAWSNARLCPRKGFICLDRTRTTVGWTVDPGPSPEGPIDLRYAEFERAVAMPADVGFPWNARPKRLGLTSGVGGSTTRRWPPGWLIASSLRRHHGRGCANTSERTFPNPPHSPQNCTADRYHAGQPPLRRRPPGLMKDVASATHFALMTTVGA